MTTASCNFVVALLNDLVGPQGRGGWLGSKPGWTRLSFSFYLSEPAVQFIVTAVHLVAIYGARLLPEYRLDPAFGRWRHRHAPAPPVGLSRPGGGHRRVAEAALGGYLSRARAILAAAGADGDANGHTPAPAPVPDRFERLRWFELPNVCLPGGVA